MHYLSLEEALGLRPGETIIVPKDFEDHLPKEDKSEALTSISAQAVPLNGDLTVVGIHKSTIGAERGVRYTLCGINPCHVYIYATNKHENLEELSKIANNTALLDEEKLAMWDQMPGCFYLDYLWCAKKH